MEGRERMLTLIGDWGRRVVDNGVGRGDKERSL